MKYSVLPLVLALMLITACSTPPEKAFDTNDVTVVTLHVSINNLGDVVVPDEALPEILAWLDAMTVGQRHYQPTVPPGTGSVMLTLSYADGRVMTINPDIVTRDGISYDVDAPAPPASYKRLVNGSYVSLP